MSAPDSPARPDRAHGDGRLPRVSCIMPTRDRRAFVAQAVRYFRRQDYPDTELIVVDDGYDEVADLMPDDPRIRYVRLRSAQSIGAKRNLACQQATGDIIAHWDDDDWSAPSRLRVQVSALLASDADVCGLSEVLHFRPLRGDGWLYRGDARSRVAGCSIVYRRSVWAESAFPDVTVGEDSAFVGRLQAHRVFALADRSLMVAVVHGRNVTSLPLGTPQWAPADLDEIAMLLGPDRSFYSTLRGGGDVARPRPNPSGPALSVAAAFEVFSGYGSTGEYLALSLARAGASVRAVPLSVSPVGVSDELLAMTRIPARDRDEPAIFHSWVNRDFEAFRNHPDLYISTMYEASRLPSDWPSALARARTVIVPSTFVVSACRASGVTRPVVVVPLGADPDIYHWQPRQDRAGLVSLIVAPVDDRKHTLLAIAAWKAAFADAPEARLIIKTTYGYHNYVPDDPRISYEDRAEARRGIAAWYQRADILLALGNEGFGLPMVEAMASGLAVVALDAEGQADVCRDARGLLFSVPAAGQTGHADHRGSIIGYRSVPDFDAVVGHLRWIDSHRDEARAIGRAAAEWTSQHRNIWSVGPAVLDIVQSTTTRMRRRPDRMLWVTTAGTPCGIAAYTARLQRNLPGVRLSATAPTLPSGSIVHIQHEPSIMDDESLERFMVQARAAGTAVAITEHAVLTRPAPWERHARALVAATSAGAARLRGRHPGIPVVHIPLGCETWSFPRKARRGRTIGFFGFPGEHKGHGRMSAALRLIPGCEVLMFGYGTPARESLRDWPADVPVRCESDWLPLPEVAAQLAARADVLVFHYDEFSHHSASSAVLVGLSTGVPVLTSATNWFDDHGDAVYRAGRDAAGLAAGLERLLDDDELRERTVAAAREYCVSNSWSRTAARHVELWNSFETG